MPMLQTCRVNTTNVRAAPPPNDGVRWARRAAYLAIAGVLLGIVVSGNTLINIGIPYKVPGGNPAIKIHPGSYLVLLGTLMAMAVTNPFRFAIRASRTAPACMAYLVVVAISMIYVALRFGTSGVAFIVDTLLVPGLLALLLTQAPPGVAAVGFRVALAILAVNAAIGIGEGAMEVHLIPFLNGDQPMVEPYFRATALAGHPLVNALLTMLAFFAAIVLRVNPLIRAGLCLLYMVGLLAFGGRTALAATIMLSIGLGVLWACRAVLRRLLRPHHLLAAVGLAVTLPILVGLAYLWLGLGQRIVGTMYWDASANARLNAFQIFHRVSWAEFAFGMPPERVASLIDYLIQYASTMGIENFWILFLLQFGLYFLVLFGISFAALLVWLGRRAPAPARAMIVGFAIVASSNNSLATKTVMLSMLVLFAIGSSDEHLRVRRRA